MIEDSLVRFHGFLKFRGDECFVLDYGHKAYDTGDNLLGEICNANLSSFNCSAYNKARFLDLDFSKWILRQRKMILNRLRKETEDL